MSSLRMLAFIKAQQILIESAASNNEKLHCNSFPPFSYANIYDALAKTIEWAHLCS